MISTGAERLNHHNKSILGRCFLVGLGNLSLSPPLLHIYVTTSCRHAFAKRTLASRKAGRQTLRHSFLTWQPFGNKHAMSLFALIGAVDNLDEPTPLINRRATIFGLVITSLVINSKRGRTRKIALTIDSDCHLTLCHSTATCQVFCNTMPWLG